MAGTVVLVAVCLGGGGSPSEALAAGGNGPLQRGEAVVSRSAEWAEVDRLIEEQKNQAAVSAVREIRSRAIAAEDAKNWTLALVREAQLTAALGGVESAVRLLAGEPWPEDPRARIALELLYAHSLTRYLDYYGWEIGQRERIGPRDQVDLGQWTREQVIRAVEEAFLALWADREAWDIEPLAELSAYVDPNDYPARIRGTLRDALTHLWVDVLGNTAYWSPAESNAVYRLDFAALAGGEQSGPGVADHPLARLSALLADLERWHAEAGRSEAAFDALLTRIDRLRPHVGGDDDRRTLEEQLSGALAELGESFEWWSVGQELLAQIVRAADEPSSLLEARDLARQGLEAHPESIGGRRCAHLVASLETPTFSLEAMRSDGADRRSIAVRHKNLERLHFRAYRLDLERALTTGQDYNLLPSHRAVEKLLAGDEPDFVWAVELPETPDLREHRTFVTPESGETGLYVVAASARPGFRAKGNRVQAIHWVKTGLVLLASAQGQELQAEVLSGASGDPVSGATLELWQLDYRAGHRRIGSATTAADGTARLDSTGERRVDALAIARLAGDVTFERVSFGPGGGRPEREYDQALVYTDRSVYRPGQEILWKLVAYRRSAAKQALEVRPGAAATVELLDANYEVVDSVEVETNGFGSASGRFSIPLGRLLGSWQLRTSVGGQAQVQVEEYKRPTFEVTLDEPAESQRLNRPAQIEGEARYYFGLPIIDAQVRWRATREPRYPPWWGWLRRTPQRGAEVVAAGETRLDAAGRFAFAFTPQADEREAADGVAYRYTVDAEVTDSGGETRSASRAFTLGFVAVRATLEAQRAFFTPDVAPSYEIRRTDLDGVGRAGAARWTVVALELPAEVALPADEPLPTPDDEETFATPGDLQRPRWATDYRVAERLRSWRDGAEVANGRLEHGENGEARLELPALPSGAYRLRYETEDSFGALFETQDELIVAGGTPLPLPAFLAVERSRVPVGAVARILVHSALPEQSLTLEVTRPGRPRELRRFEAGSAPIVVDLPIEELDRGGVHLLLRGLRDYQLMTLAGGIVVPPPERDLDVRFTTFRDLLRPGAHESWRITLAGSEGDELAAGAAEVLTYMYDRSLDLFAPHQPPRPEGFRPHSPVPAPWRSSLGRSNPVLQREQKWHEVPPYPRLQSDQIRFFDSYGIGGPGHRRLMQRGGPQMMEAPSSASVEMAVEATSDAGAVPVAEQVMKNGEDGPGSWPPEGAGDRALRTDFSETAFWEPHLVTDGDGEVAFEFDVPDSVTEWNVWVHALTRELRYGSLEQRVRTAKDLLVRPYLPRFLREGDRAELKIVVQNAGEKPLSGELELDLLDPATGVSMASDFGLANTARKGLPFAVGPGESEALTVALQAPRRVGSVAVRVMGEAGDWSDGELRPLPLLPGRYHLSQSRFAALDDAVRRVLVFEDLGADDDPSRIDEQLVVTLDAQLFDTVLAALPYLVDYPYECTEQILNRFLSTGIVSSVFEDHPAVAGMAAQLAQRETELEPWSQDDPNRSMALVETPWLHDAAGGETSTERLIRVLDPGVARAERDTALASLRQAQTSLGGFPWWPGGPPSPHMTLYILSGLSRALEFGIEIPRDLVVPAWRYLRQHYLAELVAEMEREEGRHELLTMLNFVLSSYPDESWTPIDESWTGGVFTKEDRLRMLEHSFQHWREHSPLLKGYLALTLKRAGRDADARLVFDSVMDSAKTSEDLGTYWAPEERAWLWYNDTIETHALALRVLGEIDPDDPSRQGLVHWLMLNKKLSHWKSTRATAEVLYSLVHYLAGEGELGQREEATVELGGETRRFVFEPGDFAGRERQIVLPGTELSARHATITVAKETPGLLFASATWHFSTEQLPTESRSDFFGVERRYYRRLQTAGEWVLEPLVDGTVLTPGDQVEVQLSLRTRHAAEYVHLRDPRAAGFEPESLISGYNWDLGIGWYEQVRDSGTDFFFEWLPVGEYTFKYRLRANLGGTFKAGPATVQSMYAPEFTAYSSGATLTIGATP